MLRVAKKLKKYNCCKTLKKLKNINLKLNVFGNVLEYLNSITFLKQLKYFTINYCKIVGIVPFYYDIEKNLAKPTGFWHILRWRITVAILQVLHIWLVIEGLQEFKALPFTHRVNLFRLLRWIVLCTAGFLHGYTLFCHKELLHVFNVTGNILNEYINIKIDSSHKFILAIALLCIVNIFCGLFSPILPLLQCELHFGEDILNECQTGRGYWNKSYWKITFGTLLQIFFTMDICCICLIYIILISEGILSCIIICEKIEKFDQEENEYLYNPRSSKILMHSQWIIRYRILEIYLETFLEFFRSTLFPTAAFILITGLTLLLSIVIHCYKEITFFPLIFLTVISIISSVCIVILFKNASQVGIKSSLAIVEHKRWLQRNGLLKKYLCSIRSFHPIYIRIGNFHSCTYYVLAIVINVIFDYTVTVLVTLKEFE